MVQHVRITVLALIACTAFAQNAPSSQGETALKTLFVEVQPDVKLEVLDWGGTGRTSLESRGAVLVSPPQPKPGMA
jgi:hypothetical protein